MSKGMVIIGYQGIGKSSVAKDHKKFIDLESSLFKDDNGFRHEDWYKYYVNIAINLAELDFYVFISSHDKVRGRLDRQIYNLKPDIDVIEIFPSLSLEGKWIKRLKDRYEKLSNQKNYIAYKSAEENYKSNIEGLKKDSILFNFKQLIIEEDDFNNGNFNLYDFIFSKID